MKRRLFVVLGFALPMIFANLSFNGWATELEQKPPSDREPAGPRPSLIVEKLNGRPQPQLTGSGEQAVKNAREFIEWASASSKKQSEAVRKAVTAARNNKDIMNAFCEEAFESQKSDHSRSLVILSLVGEAKSPMGQECLIKFVQQSLPEKGTMVDGEILEQTALATLQAKAIDGLAYLHNEQADRVVLATVAKHPSRIVRAEAIAAYLWNHENSQKAREVLAKQVQPDERIFIDRVVKLDGEDREVFNRKLKNYLKEHPEALPPAPMKKDERPEHKLKQPPAF